MFLVYIYILTLIHIDVKRSMPSKCVAQEVCCNDDKNEQMTYIINIKEMYYTKILCKYFLMLNYNEHAILSDGEIVPMLSAHAG